MADVKYIASCSWGKDSTAMILKLIERREPLDEVIFYDTGMEFNAIYNVRDMILPILEKNSVKYTELKPDNLFLYDMLIRPKVKRKTKQECRMTTLTGILARYRFFCPLTTGKSISGNSWTLFWDRVIPMWIF